MCPPSAHCKRQRGRTPFNIGCGVCSAKLSGSRPPPPTVAPPRLRSLSLFQQRERENPPGALIQDKGRAVAVAKHQRSASLWTRQSCQSFSFQPPLHCKMRFKCSSRLRRDGADRFRWRERPDELEEGGTTPCGAEREEKGREEEANFQLPPPPPPPLSS